MPYKKTEILAPAGSYAAFEAAVKAGADAVYVGGQRFGARAYADNFTEEELTEAIRQAHFYGRKLYLTVNTLLKDDEIDGLYDYLAPYYKCGLDAVIVQDMGVVKYIKEAFQGLDIHASTQMTVTGAAGARFVEACGMTRVVPARELSLEEIRMIRDETDLEIECFVHGALCYCYSGQCLLSSMIGGRSGNRGQCAQPCRLLYTFDGKKRYYLSPKDICTLDLIPDMIDAGIDSFKIEGRMKKPEYVALVTSMYRKYTDLYMKKGRSGYRVLPGDRERLMDIYNRGGFSGGYYRVRNGREMMSLDRPNHAGVDAAAVEYQKGREVRARALTALHPGDVLEIAGKKNDHTLGSAVKKGEAFSFLVQKNVRLAKGQTLRRIRNESLIEYIRKDILERELQRGVHGEITLAPGSRAFLSVSCDDTVCGVYSEETVQEAKNRPMDTERIRTQLGKTGGSGFYFERLDIHTDGNVFLPVGQLNALRRSAFQELKREMLRKHERTLYERNLRRGDTVPEQKEWTPRYTVCVETREQLAETSKYMRDHRMNITRLCISSHLLSGEDAADGKTPDAGDSIRSLLSELKECTDDRLELVIALPHVFRETGNGQMEDILRAAAHIRADGFLVRNCGEYEALKEHGFDKKVILDHNLYVFNRYAKEFWRGRGIRSFTAPLELNSGELSKLGIEDCELEIYGHTPVMVSAQCLFRTAGGCRHSSGTSRLTDRRGSSLWVQACCDSCYNVIYSERPVFLAGAARDIPALSPASLRVRFTVENAEKTGHILDMTRKAFEEGGNVLISEEEYTQGHFRRGVL